MSLMPVDYVQLRNTVITSCFTSASCVEEHQ